MNKINILFSCDSNYVMPLSVCLTSVFENNKDAEVCAFVFHSRISDIQKEVLTELAKKYDQKINLVEVADYYYKDAPTLRWSKEMYYRLLISELLPVDLKRILYLDCDIIVNKSLKELFNLDLGDNYISALRTEVKYEDFGKRLGLDKFGYFYQSGVILFDLKKCREVLSYKKSIEVIDSLGKKIVTPDQDVINIIFYKKIQDLNMIYNNDEITNYCRNNSDRLFNRIDEKLLADTVVFHYAAGKPWNNIFSGSCEDVWNKYLILSPYRNLYEEKFKKIKYKILRTSIMKVIFFKYTNATPHINRLFLFLFPQGVYRNLKQFYRNKIK